MVDPSDRHLEWAAAAISASARVISATGMHDGSSPWRLDIRDGARLVRVVLRVADWGRIWGQAIATAAAGLRIAEVHRLRTARLIASDVDGAITGEPALLETFCPGLAGAPAEHPDLFSAGAALAAVHAIQIPASHDLPIRSHHTPADDHPTERRWAHRYQHSPAADRDLVVEEFLRDRSWLTREQAEHRLRTIPTSPLLAYADERISQLTAPAGDLVFLHGDIWFGNTLWNDRTCVGLIDWKSAGVGHPGVDLGSLRMRAAIAYGLPVAEEVTTGWEHTTGTVADATAYWDTIAALHTPADEDPAGRDNFLHDALNRLDTGNGT